MARISDVSLSIDAEVLGNDPQATLTVNYTAEFDLYDRTSNERQTLVRDTEQRRPRCWPSSRTAASLMPIGSLSGRSCSLSVIRNCHSADIGCSRF